MGGAQAEREQREITASAGRILVMDDEDAGNEMLAEMLHHLGYQAKTVKDGATAVTAYRQALGLGEPFTAVITDLTVPAGMGGKEIVRRLFEIDPQAKVIVSSGQANDPIMSEYAEYGFKGVIPKPYNLEDLGKTPAGSNRRQGPGLTAQPVRHLMVFSLSSCTKRTNLFY